MWTHWMHPRPERTTLQGVPCESGSCHMLVSTPHLVHVGHQVVWHSNRVLADIARWVCTNWVEVPQQQDAPVAVRCSHIPAAACTDTMAGRIPAATMVGYHAAFDHAAAAVETKHSGKPWASSTPSQQRIHARALRDLPRQHHAHATGSGYM